MSAEPFSDYGQTEDPFAQNRVLRWNNLGVHYPTWHMPPIPQEEAKDIVVTQDGKPIEPIFRLSEVAPDRRWAVRRSGEVMGQLEFKADLDRKFVEWFQINGRNPEDPSTQHVPRVQDYVSFRVAPVGDRLERIRRDPSTPHPKIVPRYNADGELATESDDPFVPPSGYTAKEVKPETDLERENATLRETLELLRSEVDAINARTKEAALEHHREIDKKHRDKKRAKAAEEKADDGVSFPTEQLQYCGSTIAKNEVGLHTSKCKICKDGYQRDRDKTAKQKAEKRLAEGEEAERLAAEEARRL